MAVAQVSGKFAVYELPDISVSLMIRMDARIVQGRTFKVLSKTDGHLASHLSATASRSS